MPEDYILADVPYILIYPRFMDKHNHNLVFAAIAASTVVSLLGTYFMVQQQQIDQVGGRANYSLYKQMVNNTKYQENVRKSLESQVQMLNGEQPAADTGTETPTAPSAVTLDTIKGLFVDGNIHFGSPDAKLLLVEISDPSCPYCHAAGGKNPELNKQMGAQFIMKADGGSYVAPVTEFKKLLDAGKASFVFLYSNGHGAGELAAQALYCANEKGKFWNVHDRLMSMEGYNMINNEVKNDKANSGKLADFLAKEIDKSFLKDCLESGKYAKNLVANQQTASNLGSRGTPGFFVNTTNFAGAVNYTNMESAVTAALK